MTAIPYPITVRVRALTPDDLDAVAAIDAAADSRTRRAYLERRLADARREPALHAQFAAVDAQGLAGFVLGRMLLGEFGRDAPALRVERFGVQAAQRGRGVGHALLAALAAWGSRHGARELHTTALWRRTDLLRWFDHEGFELAPHHVLQSAVGVGGWAPPDAATSVPAAEIDYGRPEGNDHERLARDGVDVRAMQPADLDAIVRIDREIVGADRRGYIGARLDEARHDAAIRVSLAARRDGAVVGYLMARADLGDFGRTEPVAVLDTLGVDPAQARGGIGRALLGQLFAHLQALRVERVETLVPQHRLDLLGFLHSAGFGASPRLVFTRSLDPA